MPSDRHYDERDELHVNSRQAGPCHNRLAQRVEGDLLLRLGFVPFVQSGHSPDLKDRPPFNQLPID